MPPIRTVNALPSWRGRRWPGLVIACLLAWALAGSGTTVRPVTVEQLTAGSTHVVVATAEGSYSAWDVGHNAIYTYTTFLINKALKGQFAHSTFVVKQFGGEVGNTVSRRIGVRQFTAGEQSVLFLFPSPNGDGTMLVTGLMQGRFAVRRSGGSATVSNGLPLPGRAAAIYEVGAPVLEPYRMPLDTLEQRVRNAAGRKAEQQ